ncbi:hypothetical protein QFC22_002665 [Naganishia vaughanmartiniae]|uniref:Uncharacterized protein n=1 Tax=Naganishia vaughanmartiniae TaxID=1424756 RepID=A0ACC2XBI8_9TREE|nr:hypothetical protein QFC22_002665 [Naganishia vaughanmartiniae]
MGASTALPSGQVTPISELPPSIMGEGDIANGDSHQQLPMDYFDFDLSSFASDGGLTSTGINLGINGDDDGQIQNFLDTSTRTESAIHGNGNTGSAAAPAAAIWGEGDQRLSGGPAEKTSQPAMMQGNQQLHEQFAVEPNTSQSHAQPSTTTDTQRRLESIQMQQMNLQRQLDELQQQQRQQHDQNSQSQMHQYQHQQQTYHQPQQRQAAQQDPNHTGSYVSPMVYPQTHVNFGSALSLTTGTPLQGPSPANSNTQEFFSPLGSPALGPIQHGASVRKRHRSSLSNATSPASMSLNHLPQYVQSRNAEAATVSPALLPQGALHAQRFMNMDGNNQAYLTDWAKLLSDNSSTSSSQISEASLPSPVHRKSAELAAQFSQYEAHTESHNMHSRQMNPRPASTQSPALGPHRSGNGKTRPSPMIKPSQRPGRSNLGNGNSVTSSPLVVATTNGTNYSPAIIPGGQFVDGVPSGSVGSGSLSPVDLSTILMPPPPPPHQRTEGNSAKFSPITPAALMQIGAVGGLSVLQESTHTPRAVHEPALSLRTRHSSQSQTQTSQSQSQTPKAEQATLPNLEATISVEMASKHQLPVGQSGLISAIALERLRAIKPGAKTTTFRPTTKASPLLQATKNGKSSKMANEANIPPEVRKSSHKQAEQRRRDSLKSGFDELRLLLPPINAEALDPETGEPIPGSSAPRLLPKSSLVPDSNPNKAVSKVALLKYSNEYIGRLNGKVERRDNYIDILKEAIRSCRHIAGFGPDEQLDELLDYAFEDEDEDEVPTGVAMAQELAQQQDQDGSLQTSVEEKGKSVANQMEGPTGAKRGRKSVANKDVSGTTTATTPTTRGKRKPVETPVAGSTGNTRAGRKGRRDSTLSIVMPEGEVAFVDDVEVGEEGLANNAQHTNGLVAIDSAELLTGTDCDVDMLFDTDQRV